MAHISGLTERTLGRKRQYRPISGRPALLALPNLFLRSTVTLVGLYALLTAALIAAAEFGGVDPRWAVGAGSFIIALQFLVGPFVMDLMLGWLYRMSWLTPDQVPGHLAEFMARVCAANRMKAPRLGLIDDGAPQAFTYGHTPNNARIVISRGILELLDEREVEAVVAHEIGHVVNWDMLLMTVAQMVPLVCYYVYQSLTQEQRSNEDAPGRWSWPIAAGAFVLYIVSEYAVLWFSRTREYHADRFSGEATGDPSLIASALATIAFGLASKEKSSAEGAVDQRRDSPARASTLSAVGALGIFDSRAAASIAIAACADNGATDRVHLDRLRRAMRWDLWNPWSRWHELNSTHPLVANRLRYLCNQAIHMGQKPYVVFDDIRPESYWDEFAIDFTIYVLPLAALIAGPMAVGGLTGLQQPLAMAGAALAAFGAALLIKYCFVYRADAFPATSVAALLAKVKVSGVRPAPCSLRGIVIGRGLPGYILSEDFILKDESGIIFLDYRQPFGIWEVWFGLSKAGRLVGKHVTVEGWYRRSPMPFVEIRSIGCEGKQYRSWIPVLYKMSALAFLIAGLGVALLPDGAWTWFATHCEAHFLQFACKF